MVFERIETEEEAVILSEIAANAGALMLANGAEIYRVEDTVERIIRSKPSIKDVDVWSSFNAIMISFSYQGQIHTNIRRVKSRSNNLFYVNKVNSFSRRFATGEMTLDEAIAEIEDIRHAESIPRNYKILGATIAAGAYSILLGAGMAEIVSSLVVGFIGYIFSLFLEKNKLNYFVVHFLYGILVSLLTLTINSFTRVTVDVVIISAMMAFVPGMMVTNAVRDLMSGDATSGVTGVAMAILISTALALGVAVPITIAGYMGLL